MRTLLTMLFSAIVARAAHGADASSFPAWLQSHVGEGENQIAPVVLQRARDLYLGQINAGKMKNPCYLAMDATRPHQIAEGKAGNRFYVICEASQSFRAISSGHGSGVKVGGVDATNGKHCVKNFSNAEGSMLTAGGPYGTADVINSFKGRYKDPATGKEVGMHRDFVNFYGERETANARKRDIGGHSSVLVAKGCYKYLPTDPDRDKEGYVFYGEFEDYTDGRSNGCTNWAPAEAAKIVNLVRGNPTTLYIYPESKDINALANGIPGVYWNSECLHEIGTPKFWPRETLEPLTNPSPPPAPKPKKLCPAVAPGAPAPALPPRKGSVDEAPVL